MNPIELPTLAQQINAAHARCEATAQTALQHALEAGRLLAQAKAAVDHGQWLPWLQSNCTVSIRAAQTYLRLHEHRDRLSNAQRVAHLPVRDALRMIAAPRLAKATAAVTSPAPQPESFVILSDTDLIPPAGYALVGDIGQGELVAWIEPHQQDGYSYVTVMHRKADGVIEANGDTRGAANVHIRMRLDSLHFPTKAARWSAVACEPQSFNRWLYENAQDAQASRLKLPA